MVIKFSEMRMLSDKNNRLWVTLQYFKVWIQVPWVENLNSCSERTGIRKKEVLFFNFICSRSGQEVSPFTVVSQIEMVSS